MSTALDKSLDDIISSSRKTKKVQANRKKTVGKAVGKGVGKAQKKQPVVTFKKSKPAAAPKAATPAIDLTYATKVVAHGLPRDLKQENVKDFFQSQIGGVQTVSMNYNEKGNFKGIATIIFKSSKNAVLAVEKYNNAPIDGGASKLKLELIIDPTKKPLAARITANKPASAQVAKGQSKKEQLKQKLNEKRKQLQKKKADAKPKQKPSKPVKKTAEQLDQEMSDYFNN
ncbi:putative RNA annealing protein [Clavispora lusitaniae]|uniref:RNA-binding protein n=2 Tax=Clavispora lusitaniae TaxID=36911 RepID=A0AA91T197_CLALS|nr:RNA recognition motif family protein [Clavispora lusitaniae]OVF07772.1 putative RNA-binding protein [Clavispora lusitaniae]QFZ28934.1 putative RNA annealing protein [Clavispora lusitaniae]QFZ34597.1 putative RNA annealing protein [Clavispora lusitaniae]QFZ40282.1 putative RNA annealing protein [Clavispora lusitaniae]